MSSENFEQVSRWYVVYTLPNYEQRADSNLRAWHLETFAPKIKARRVNPFNGVSIYVTRPLFPRYIFARFNLNALMHKVRFTRGVSNVVSFGGLVPALGGLVAWWGILFLPALVYSAFVMPWHAVEPSG